MKLNRIMIWITISIIILALIGGATLLQMIPFALGIFLMWKRNDYLTTTTHFKIKNSIKEKIIALAVIMFIINIIIPEPSIIDLVYWFAFGVVGYLD